MIPKDPNVYVTPENQRRTTYSARNYAPPSDLTRPQIPVTPGHRDQEEIDATNKNLESDIMSVISGINSSASRVEGFGKDIGDLHNEKKAFTPMTKRLKYESLDVSKSLDHIDRSIKIDGIQAQLLKNELEIRQKKLESTMKELGNGYVELEKEHTRVKLEVDQNMNTVKKGLFNRLENLQKEMVVSQETAFKERFDDYDRKIDQELEKKKENILMDLEKVRDENAKEDEVKMKDFLDREFARKVNEKRIVTEFNLKEYEEQLQNLDHGMGNMKKMMEKNKIDRNIESLKFKKDFIEKIHNSVKDSERNLQNTQQQEINGLEERISKKIVKEREDNEKRNSVVFSELENLRGIAENVRTTGTERSKIIMDKIVINQKNYDERISNLVKKMDDVVEVALNKQNEEIGKIVETLEENKTSNQELMSKITELGDDQKKQYDSSSEKVTGLTERVDGLEDATKENEKKTLEKFDEFSRKMVALSEEQKQNFEDVVKNSNENLIKITNEDLYKVIETKKDEIMTDVDKKILDLEERNETKVKQELQKNNEKIGELVNDSEERMENLLNNVKEREKQMIEIAKLHDEKMDKSALKLNLDLGKKIEDVNEQVKVTLAQNDQKNEDKMKGYIDEINDKFDVQDNLVDEKRKVFEAGFEKRLKDGEKRYLDRVEIVKNLIEAEHQERIEELALKTKEEQMELVKKIEQNERDIKNDSALNDLKEEIKQKHEDFDTKINGVIKEEITQLKNNEKLLPMIESSQRTIKKELEEKMQAVEKKSSETDEKLENALKALEIVKENEKEIRPQIEAVSQKIETKMEEKIKGVVEDSSKETEKITTEVEGVKKQMLEKTKEIADRFDGILDRMKNDHEIEMQKKELSLKERELESNKQIQNLVVELQAMREKIEQLEKREPSTNEMGEEYLKKMEGIVAGVEKEKVKPLVDSVEKMKREGRSLDKKMRKIEDFTKEFLEDVENSQLEQLRDDYNEFKEKLKIQNTKKNEGSKVKFKRLWKTVLFTYVLVIVTLMGLDFFFPVQYYWNLQMPT